MLEHLLSWDQQLTLSLNGSSSLFWDGFFWTVTSTSTWVPMAFLLLYIVIRNHKAHNALWVVLLAGVAVLLADQVSSGICKPLFHRFRPSNDPDIMYMVDVVNGYRGGQYGFFSSHAANTFALTTFFSLLIRQRRLTVTLYIWALLNCWSRVYLGVHYVGDVTVGALWGSLVGWGLYKLLQYLERKNVQPQPDLLIYTQSGFSIKDADLLTTGFLLTFIYLFIRAVLFSW